MSDTAWATKRGSRAGVALAIALIASLLVVASAPAQIEAPPRVAGPWQVDEDMLDAIKAYEGLGLTLYNDGPPDKQGRRTTGHCTIGYGHLVHYGVCNGKDASERPFLNGITQDQADAMLTSDIENKALSYINECVSVPLNHFELVGLVSFVFNNGPGPVCKQTPKGTKLGPVGTLLDAGKYDKVPGRIKLYNKVDKIVTVEVTDPKTGKKHKKRVKRLEVSAGLVNRRAYDIFDFTFGAEGRFRYPCRALQAAYELCSPPRGKVLVRVSLIFEVEGSASGSVKVSPPGRTASTSSPFPSYGNPAVGDLFFYTGGGATIGLTATHGANSYFDGWARTASTSGGVGCADASAPASPSCSISVTATGKKGSQYFPISTTAVFAECPPPGTRYARPGAVRDCPGVS